MHLPVLGKDMVDTERLPSEYKEVQSLMYVCCLYLRQEAFTEHFTT